MASAGPSSLPCTFRHIQRPRPLGFQRPSAINGRRQSIASPIRAKKGESPLQYRKLGDSDLQISEITLGTMTFGEQNTEKEAHDMLNYAFEQGINIVDTAEMYPVPPKKETQGRTDLYVGSWMKSRPRDKIFINVSLRHYACNTLFSPLFTQGARSKLIFARPSKVTKILLKFIAPENIPVEHGGLKREDDQELSAEDGGVSEKVVKGGCATTIVIPITEPGVTVVWELTVVGWEVSYKEEFIPVDEGSYRVLIRKERNLEESIRNSFYINEPGKVVLTIDNRTLKKKRILYRSTSKPTVPLYSLLSQTHHRVV